MLSVPVSKTKEEPKPKEAPNPFSFQTFKEEESSKKPGLSSSPAAPRPKLFDDDEFDAPGDFFQQTLPR